MQTKCLKNRLPEAVEQVQVLLVPLLATWQSRTPQDTLSNTYTESQTHFNRRQHASRCVTYSTTHSTLQSDFLACIILAMRIRSALTSSTCMAEAISHSCLQAWLSRALLSAMLGSFGGCAPGHQCSAELKSSKAAQLLANSTALIADTTANSSRASQAT